MAPPNDNDVLRFFSDVNELCRYWYVPWVVQMCDTTVLTPGSGSSQGKSVRMRECDLGYATCVESVLRVPGAGETARAPSGEAVDPAGGVSCAGG